jgi:hypothetical protein
MAYEAGGRSMASVAHELGCTPDFVQRSWANIYHDDVTEDVSLAGPVVLARYSPGTYGAVGVSMTSFNHLAR